MKRRLRIQTMERVSLRGHLGVTMDYRSSANRSDHFFAGTPVPSLRNHGFTLIELLTVIAIIAVLATLLLSTLAAAQKRSRQTVCTGNLRQIVLATEIYQDETGRRARSLSRLTAKPAALSNSKSLVCPVDPILRGTFKVKPSSEGVTNAVWGNYAQSSQEPINSSKDQLEEGSWEAEIAATRESLPFTYLHALSWRKPAWTKLNQSTATAGYVACQVHGVRSSNSRIIALAKEFPYLAWEGRLVRGQRDGAVVQRRLFHSESVAWDAPQGGTVAPARPGDYPWEFYTDSWPQMLK